MYWTETHESIHGDSQEAVLNAYGYHWDKRPPGVLGAKVLLEKSPPNAVLARYLEALVDYRPGARPQTCDADDETCAPPPKASRAKFVFVTRHPIATALSHQQLGGVSGLSLSDLVAHWLAVQEYASENARRVAHVFLPRGRTRGLLLQKRHSERWYETSTNRAARRDVEE